MKAMTRPIYLRLFALALVVMVVWSERAPRPDTLRIIRTAESRIRDYVAQHHHLPAELSDVPTIAGTANVNTDEWGNPLVYTPMADGSIVIASNGKAGGRDGQAIRFSLVVNEDKIDHANELDTFDSIEYDRCQIGSYASTHHRIPDGLSEVQGIMTDGWHNPIIYSRSSDDLVVLISHGKPGTNQIFSLQFEVPDVATTEPSPATTQSKS